MTLRLGQRKVYVHPVGGHPYRRSRRGGAGPGPASCIVFRDGPTGRRAGLAGGPDVWEVIAAIRAGGLEGDAARETAAEWGALSATQVRAAVGYYAEYGGEIDERIRRNVEDADAAEQRWRREQDALA